MTRPNLTRRRLAAAIAAGSCLPTFLPGAVQAQAAWPNKPIRLIAPYAPGGQTDQVSRWLAERLQPALGQQVLVENRAGAQGIVGIQAAKAAPADGYTLVYTNVSNISLNPHLYDKLPYDGLKDFVPISQLGLSVLAMVVPPALGVKTVKDFVAYAKANPGKVSFASFGAGSTSHVYGEMLKIATGIDMAHVAYKGAAPAVQDVIAGHATMGIHDLATVGPQVQAGRLVALAVTGPQRWPTMPDLPTFAEQGYPLDIAGWNGIMAPAGTPRPVVDRLAAEINRAVQSPEGREALLRMGLLATGLAPDAFSEVIRRDTPRWGEVIRRNGIKAE
ncbi:MAG: Bug family tripartite tricarboxylate transporter substrate binding protein [Aquabacterium sp.]